MYQPLRLIYCFVLLSAASTTLFAQHAVTTTVGLPTTSMPCDATKQQSAIARLGAQVRIDFDANHIPSWIRGTIGPRASADPVEAATATLRNISDVFCASPDDDFAFTRRVEKEDRLGQSFVRVQQTYRGLDVLGAELIVHMTNDAVIMVNGSFVAGIRISTAPILTEKDASSSAVRHIASVGGKKIKLGSVEKLVIYIDNKQQAHLAYPVHIGYETDNPRIDPRTTQRFLDERVFIDAATGQYLSSWSTISSAHDPVPTRPSDQ